MKIETGFTYKSAEYAKALTASEAKVGKTTFLIGSCLGVLPWQKSGGVVDTPENLHVISFDSNALGGIARFITETCKAPKEALNFKVYNLQDTMRRVSESDNDYDMSFYFEVMEAIEKIRQTAKGVPAVIISSLTGLASGFERAIVGPPTGKGYSDPSKWKALAHQLHEVQNFVQVDRWHTFWEGHVDKPATMQVGQNAPQAKETIRVSGEAGRNWGYNVEQIFRIRRNFGTVFGQSKVDQVYLDTRPSLDFVASGRGFTEALEPKEPDLTVALDKLGLKTGHWGAK